MAREHFKNAAKHWQHWLVYFTVTFLSLYVFGEFALSISFFSILSPSTFMFYFTPAGFILGEALVSFFISVLFFIGLLFVLREKVYVKNENSMKFNRSSSYLLLPFYLVSLGSLGIYISMIPLELSNIVTYVVFLILFDSFVEHVQVSGYSLAVPKPLKDISLSISKTEEEELKSIEETLDKIDEEVEKTQMQECPNCGIKVPDDAEKCTACGELLVEEIEEVEEAVSKKEKAIQRLKKLPTVGEKKAQDLYENGFESPEVIVERGLKGLAEITHISFDSAKQIVEGSKELVSERENLEEVSRDEIIEELKEVGELEEVEEEIEEVETEECPVCGAEIPVDAEECPACGEPLVEEGEETEEVEEPEEPEKKMSEKEKAIQRLKEIPSVGEERAEDLYVNDFESPEDIVNEGITGLARIEDLNFKNAKEILEGAKEVQDEKTD